MPRKRYRVNEDEIQDLADLARYHEVDIQLYIRILKCNIIKEQIEEHLDYFIRSDEKEGEQ